MIPTTVEQFGPYFLLKRLGGGGMGEVFWAIYRSPTGVTQELALKRVLPSLAGDVEFNRMFLDEATITAKLSHDHIARMYDSGEIDGTPFLAMELVRGVDLEQVFARLAKNKRLPVPVVVHLISRVCRGLDYAHRCVDEGGEPLAIVHRDVSPSNVRISYEGGIKLLDFGIAKAVARSTRTRTDMIKGKPGYMSPEQIRGLALDRRSDLFSIGVVLFELLSGERLFCGDFFEVLRRIETEEVPPPSTINPNVPPELDEIVRRALAKDRDERYQWADEIEQDLQAIADRFAQTATGVDFRRFVRTEFEAEQERDQIRSGEFKDVITAIREGRKLIENDGNWGDESSDTDDLPPTAAVNLPPTDRTEQIAQTAAIPTAEKPIQSNRWRAAAVASVLVFVGAALAWYLVLGPGRASISGDEATSIEPAAIAMNEGSGPTPPDTTDNPAPDESASEEPTPITTGGDPAATSTGANVDRIVAPPAAVVPTPRPVIENGKLTVNTDPWSVVFIDGERLGMTPIVERELPSGTHRVEFVNTDNKFRYADTVEIKAGAINTVFKEFLGDLSIHGKIPARVYMDGDLIGTVPVESLRVPAGEHGFRFVTDEQPPREQMIRATVPPFGSKVLDVNL